MEKPVKTTSAINRLWLLRVGLQSLALLATLLVGIVLIGIAQRVGWIGAATSDSVAPGGSTATATEYTCPMHPEIRQDSPGKCPICGMTLVLVTASSSTAERSHSEALSDTNADDAQYICPMMCTPPHSQPGKCPVCAMELVKANTGGGGGERSVAIDSYARRILGIRTATAHSGEVFRTIRTIGEIAYDEERVATIAAYVDGRLEEMFAEYVGVQVAKGDNLAVLYSPQLYSAQVEYLTSRQTPALNSLTGDTDRLSEVAEDNLSEFGMSQTQIEALRSTGKAQKRLPIASPIGGTVIEKHKIEGDYVKTGEPIYRVADLTTVWLMLELYPNDAAALRFGQQVEAEVQSLPGEVYTGRIAFIDPMVDSTTRTVNVRVEMTNFDGRLKPGDYATATIRVPAITRDKVYDPALAGKWISPMHPQIIRSEPGQCPICDMALVPTSELGYVDQPLPDQEVISVPRNAVLMAGDNSVVYVETEPGVFEIREVTLGALTDTQAVILDGIKNGETVATDGNFLIDSQMQLGGKPSLFDPGRSNKKDASSPKPESKHAH
ncbi:Cation efflux system protein CusB precursor [Bythopirellula goksoeyrii]|uniref:Cation efflux system protein CusB n=1 Tax=Bythopirellula goksoeyrii TaxID=1400387 RepID=A0A5B9QI08_9BACT|nr:efflux RND transporter periplasmic adaptor subunit [Bythopirellula goksoeyrii]QEG37220.1 Cation efflux system protein CusB precursor [Bythopirellula goksoeyrii]